ncbi:MAG: HAD family hydrolase [Planctomycetaceae bacterium]|nr:HAD family hydrolase [Planctomycetaceae bacterium]
MSKKAIFLDRDKTLIADPGYLADAAAVKLLPGVELAIKSLRQAGYLMVVVTNQSGIARGLLSEEALEGIHAELRRQLADKNARVDAIYYCPFHPEGTVEKYTCESDQRKPNPGMLLKAAEEHDIDLGQSWMVGDSARDIEAGQRAGCRTVRIRTPGGEGTAAGGDDEGVQADYTVRNLVEAARVILRAPSVAPPVTDAASAPAAAAAPTPRSAGLTSMSQRTAVARTMPSTPPIPAAAAALPTFAAAPDDDAADEASSAKSDTPSSDQNVRMEILRHVRQMAQTALTEREDFSLSKLMAGFVQAMAVLALLLVPIMALQNKAESLAVAQLWATVAAALQMMSLTFFIMRRLK